MERRLKVYLVGDAYQGTEQPQIRLQGKWLRDSGFAPKDQVTVRVEQGRLIIEKRGADEAPFHFYQNTE